MIAASHILHKISNLQFLNSDIFIHNEFVTSTSKFSREREPEILTFCASGYAFLTVHKLGPTTVYLIPLQFNLLHLTLYHKRSQW